MSERSPARILRVTGLPAEMAVDSVQALLRAERSVRAIDVIEGAAGDPTSSIVFVVVDPSGLARVHRKIATGFAGIEVEDVTRLGASAYVAPTATLTDLPIAAARDGRRRRATAAPVRPPPRQRSE